MPQWWDLLQGWATDGKFLLAALEALQLREPPEAFPPLIARLAAGNRSDLPPVELLEGAAMGGAWGAYASSTGTIYLNGEWIEVADDASILAVLTEELGHHLDHLFNAMDTAGDEGSIFAGLALGKTDAASLAKIQDCDSDAGFILLEGQSVPVEQAAGTPFAQSPDNPFYKFQVIARSGEQGIEKIKREVSINDKGQIAFVGSGLFEDYIAMRWAEDSPPSSYPVPEDHIFVSSTSGQQFRDISKKPILATYADPLYGGKRPTALDLYRKRGNPSRAFDIFKSSYIGNSIYDSTDSTGGIQINNAGEVLVRRTEYSLGYQLGLASDASAIPVASTGLGEKYYMFIEKWDANSTSALALNAGMVKPITMGYPLAYLWPSNYNPLFSFLFPIPLATYYPDYLYTMPFSGSLDNKGDVIFRGAMNGKNWLAIHEEGKSYDEPQHKDPTMLQDVTTSGSARVRPWAADNGTYISSFDNKLQKFDRSFNFQAVGSQFATVGPNPRISDDGSIISFYADNAIWAYVDLPATKAAPARRDYVKIAGLANDGIMDPGENIYDANGNGIVDAGEVERGIFSRFDPDSVVAVNWTHVDETIDINQNGSIDKNREEVTIVFKAYDLAGNLGIYSNRLILFEADGKWQTVASTPTLVAETGMSIPGLSGKIADLDIYDPVNNYDKGDIAFWVKTDTGQTSVIKARKQEVLYIDFVPQNSFDPKKLGSFEKFLKLQKAGSLSKTQSPYEGDLDYTLRALGGARYSLELKNQVLDIQGRIAASVRQLFDDAGVNVKVLSSLDAPAPGDGPFLHVFVGDYGGEYSRVVPLGSFSVDTMNQYVARSGSGQYINIPEKTGLVFTDAIFLGDSFTGIKNSLGAFLPLAGVGLADKNAPLAELFVLYQLISGEITSSDIVSAIASTIGHEAGHSLGLIHYPTDEKYLMNETADSPLSPWDKRPDRHLYDEIRQLLPFSQAGIDTYIKGVQNDHFFQNDRQRLAMTVGSDAPFQRDEAPARSFLGPSSSVSPPTNTAPVSTNGVLEIIQGVLTILTAASFGAYFDGDGDALAAVEISALPQAGRLEINTDSGWQPVALNQQIPVASLSADELRFVPSADASGSPYATLGFRVSDGRSLSDSIYTLAFNVSPAPVAPRVQVAIPDQAAVNGSTFRYVVPAGTFADADSGVLTYAANLDDGKPLPAWLTFQSATREFSGIPPAGFAGTLAIRVTASDGSLAATDVFTLAVGDTSPPRITGMTVLGSELQLQFSEPIDTTGLTADRFSVSFNGVVRPLAGWSAVRGASSRLNLRLSGKAPGSGQSVALQYRDLSAANNLTGVVQDFNGNDMATIAAPGRAADTFWSTANVTTLASSYTNLMLTGSALIGTANAGNNRISVNQTKALANVLSGGAGQDSMDGGAGSDLYLIGSSTEHPSAEVSDSGSSGNDELRYTATTANQTLRIFAADTGLERVSIGTGTAAAAVTTATTALNVNAADAVNALVISGNNGANRLSGSVYGDTLIGNAGNDTLIGGLGNDTLTGGAGSDLFQFGTPPNASANLDRITDFTPGTDRIGLEKRVFSSITGSGTLAAPAFRSGGVASSSSHRILFNPGNGQLAYDPDGSGPEAAVPFALLNSGLALTAAMFSLV